MDRRLVGLLHLQSSPVLADAVTPHNIRRHALLFRSTILVPWSGSRGAGAGPPGGTAEGGGVQGRVVAAPLDDALPPRCPDKCSCDYIYSTDIYNCSLPSGEVKFIETKDHIDFLCNSGTLRPSEVPLLREGGGALPVGGGVRVVVRGCALAAEPLLEALRRRGFSGASALSVTGSRTPLAACHVRGLGLRELSIATQRTRELPLAAIEALPSLRSLSLSGGLAALPPAAFRRLSQLRSLTLYDTGLDHIQNDTLQGMELLEKLALAKNQLSELPAQLLAPARGLRELDLSYNRLTHLPRSLLAGLYRLEEVQLQENKIKLTLDAAAFANLTSLAAVNLSNSELTALPNDSFSGCGALKLLYLRRTSLHSLPAGLLVGLAALEVLDLGQNGLEAFPKNFFYAQGNLIVLHLDNNNLEALHMSMFGGLNKLRVLSLRGNKLQCFVQLAFMTVAKLKKLYPSNNQDLFGYEHDWFSAPESDYKWASSGIPRGYPIPKYLVALKEFDLSWNDISYIDYTSIELLSSHVAVDLSHNNISTIYMDAETKGTAVITIDNNPFKCDCETSNLLTALHGDEGEGQRLRVIASEAKCAAPLRLRGVPLREVPRDALRCEVPAPHCPSHCHCHRTADFVALDCASWHPAGRLPLPADFHLKDMHLRLRHVDGSLRSLPSYVKKLDLSGLNLTKVPDLPLGIEVNLINNHLPEVPIVVFKNNNNTVRLARNPLDCNCSHEEDVAALLATGPGTVFDYDHLTCFDSTPVRSKQGINLCAERDLIVHASIGVVVVILLVIVVFLCRRYRYRCLMCIHQLCCCPPDSEDEDRDKDVFLSYAHPDEEWAIKLLNFLEGPPHGLKVCHHERDWVIGEFIPKQIEWSVRRSRWTVILLSRHFLASVWGLLEFRVSYIRAHKERKGRILVVVLDDVMSDPQMTADMRSYVANNTYLHVDDRLFLEKLAYALRPRREPWWRRPAPSAPSAPPAPLDQQLRAALEARAVADGVLANPAFVAPSAVEIFTQNSTT